jgi:hypothetical protein
MPSPEKLENSQVETWGSASTLGVALGPGIRQSHEAIGCSHPEHCARRPDDFSWQYASRPRPQLEANQFAGLAEYDPEYLGFLLNGGHLSLVRL